MLKVKSCPRCKGDVVRSRDQYGWVEECIQCGQPYDADTFRNNRRHLADERRNRKSIYTMRKLGRR